MGKSFQIKKHWKQIYQGVYVIGDANLGPATIVEAIADATKAANNICLVHNHHYEKKII